ncbi:MarR family winged helix-turn-helix transcriptional regulator [Pseudarthrobacter sp. NamB4]|uniref:MarR family winged helix-turn-helix transcriptional regulator n=1 Tax=Pseudarthrobacter sp. NamB4 TaxID=2576837 RepID=UPI0010FCE54C|nr:MarR family transcriptional regulator [Pseudarthrobacter sp. NamB4]TLM72758.1 MarR family transcriptional regulator [Pseudarthrobacter sp. NamB4]
MAVAPDTAADLVHQIFDLQRAVRCVATASVRGHETGVALQGVLRFVGEGESRATRLAERLGVSAPVLSRHLAGLQEQGFVVRRKDPDDGRAQPVGLTPSGVEELRQIEEQRAAALQDYLCDWSEEDAGNTARTLYKLTESLKKSVRATAAGTPTTALKEQKHG